MNYSQMTEEEIRAAAKEAGIRNWHNKKIENLLSELVPQNEESVEAVQEPEEVPYILTVLESLSHKECAKLVQWAEYRWSHTNPTGVDYNKVNLFKEFVRIYNHVPQVVFDDFLNNLAYLYNWDVNEDSIIPQSAWRLPPSWYVRTYEVCGDDKNLLQALMEAVTNA